MHDLFALGAGAVVTVAFLITVVIDTRKRTRAARQELDPERSAS